MITSVCPMPHDDIKLELMMSCNELEPLYASSRAQSSSGPPSTSGKVRLP